MTNLIVIVLLIIILGSAAGYIIKSKKKGVKCIGCPHAKECTKKSCK